MVSVEEMWPTTNMFTKEKMLSFVQSDPKQACNFAMTALK